MGPGVRHIGNTPEQMVIRTLRFALSTYLDRKYVWDFELEFVHNPRTRIVTLVVHHKSSEALFRWDMPETNVDIERQWVIPKTIWEELLATCLLAQGVEKKDGTNP